MKCFYLNRKWSRALRFFIINNLTAIILLGVLSFHSDSLPYASIWGTAIFILSIFVVISFVTSASSLVKEIEIKERSFVLNFYFFEPIEYSFNNLYQYATATFGNYRSVISHSVILEFADGKRFQIADPIIENYKEFYEFMISSEFKCFGYIGQNNWRRKKKALSRKWVVDRYEKELIEKIEKKKGVTILYIYGFIAMAMSFAMVRYIIF